MSGSGTVVPWHMWSTTHSIVLAGDQAGDESTQQLSSIEYHRPDTWSFLFIVNVTQSDTTVTGDLLVDFILTAGVGRANAGIGSTSNPFVRFRFPVADLSSGDALWKWCSQAQTVVPDDSPTTFTPADNLIRWIPAQSIQCVARARQLGPPHPNPVRLTATALFAPRSHMRPDWFVHHFTQELNGR